MKDHSISHSCSLCGDVSYYDKESLKGCTHTINGVKHVICCPCEDDLEHIFKKRN